MKLIIIRSNLKKALEAVSKISSENTNLPILKNILLKTNGSSLVISATNLELALSYTVSAKVIEPGETTIPANIFYSIINNLNNEVINIELEKDNIKIKTDNYEAVINTLPTEDFPIIPKIKGNSGFKINSEKLNLYLKKVLNATQFSDLRPEINGILFHFDGGDLKLVGTDSFRLAEKTVSGSEFESNIEQGFKEIIPLKTINELIKIFEEGVVEIYFDNNQISFKNEEVELISRLIEGNFPEYDQIIPKEFEIEAILEKNEFLNAIKVTSILSGKVSEIKIKIVKGNKYLEINSLNQGVGENKYLVPAKIKGEEIEVDFNSNYILEGVKSFFKDEKILISFNNSDKPTILKSIGDVSYFYILMPIKK